MTRGTLPYGPALRGAWVVLLVADTLEIGAFSFMTAYAGALGLSLADRQHERVSALILINPVALDQQAYVDDAPITAMR